MKKRVIASALLLIWWTVTASAADLLSPDTAILSAKEKKALGLSRTAAAAGAKPFMAGGKLVYTHGAAGIPTIIASPMQVCDVELEPGEYINEIVTGDSARWLADQGMSGKTAHVFIKPLDLGLESSAVITTDRRVYHLRLVSQKSGHTPYVGFVYTGDLRRQLATKKQEEQRNKQWQSTEDSQGQAVDLSALHFDYEVDGNAPWRPERVYDDGQKIYIQLPSSVRSGEMPVLLVKKGAKDVLVNYRVNGHTMMVDGLFETIALVVGVGGDQEAVEIRRRKR